MQKRYIVRLTDQERNELREVVKKPKGTGEKVRRAQILLKSDADGPNWSDRQIADAFSCRVQTVENVRARLWRDVKRIQACATADREASRRKPRSKIIATRLGPAPKGYSNWTLHLLARKVVELGIAESVSYETVRRTLKTPA
jgi:hypothetical protein